MARTILMIHGYCCTGAAWDAVAPAFRAQGWRVETPTLYPDERTPARPPAQLATRTLADYVDRMAEAAAALQAETGAAPVLFGHSMGGMICQKLIERGVGRAAVLWAPSTPADARAKPKLAPLITFANIAFAAKPETKAHKIWRAGFSWGVLNCVPKARHAALYETAVYDSGRVLADLAWPERDSNRTAFIDDAKIAAPILTLAGAKDRTAPVEDVRLAGAKYAKLGGAYEEYADNGHWLVDEPGTERIITDVAAWLDARVSA
jgi:alpha-beta hydrolase superfamily lysophospholipase